MLIRNQRPSGNCHQQRQREPATGPEPGRLHPCGFRISRPHPRKERLPIVGSAVRSRIKSLLLHMIKSMTGYGVGIAEDDQTKYTVEIKSLNSKFLELSMRLPKAVSDKELQLRSECSKRIERGKVSLGINVEYADPAAEAADINHVLFQKYYEQLTTLPERVGDTQASLFSLALGMPDVVSHAEEQGSETEAILLFRAFDQAFAQFDAFRRDEGQVLKTDLANRVQT